MNKKRKSKGNIAGKFGEQAISAAIAENNRKLAAGTLKKVKSFVKTHDYDLRSRENHSS